VLSIQQRDKNFITSTNKNTYISRTILIASGSSRRKLKVKGAEKFEGKGVVYCASCDGPLFTGMDVAVIGGGNAGFDTASQLLAYAKSVTLLEASDSFKAEAITLEKVLTDPKMRAITNVEILEIKGEKFVSGLLYKDKTTGEEKNLPIQGIFVEIGSTPATDFAKDILKLNEFGQIVIDHKTQRTSISGIWAAGDCTDVLYHQNNIAAGDGVKAIEDVYLWLQKN
jgi:alkyl hydroperoxide reductase subunit F